MDIEAQAEVIDDYLDALQSMPVTDFTTARAAHAHVMATVSRINQVSAATQPQTTQPQTTQPRAIVDVPGPVDLVLDKLKEWLDRIAAVMPQIVANLRNATSFSISMGTALSVTVTFAG
jgi:hypothetical protein